MSSSSSSEDSNNGNSGNSGARRGGDFGEPSSSRRRTNNEIWPEPFVEALAAQVAIDASRSTSRLDAAEALANVFQVCSMWRAVSHSDLLWHRLTRLLWRRTTRLHDGWTWRDEFIYRHRTARNFRTQEFTHVTLHFDPSDVEDPVGLVCRCLTLSDRHLACGFADGTVRLFDLATHLHVSTYMPHHGHDPLGHSRAVSGIVITNTRLVFATLGGDIHVAFTNTTEHPRRAYSGGVVEDGVLVDFAGCGQWWVGLYAGAPGRAFRIWDSNSEDVVFVGGMLTDPDAVMGWHMLHELTEFVGRVRVTSHESFVACTRTREMVFDLRNQMVLLGPVEYRRGIFVTCVDVSNESYIVVNGRGFASVRRVNTLGEVCRFRTRGWTERNIMGCMNLVHAIICAGGFISVYGVEHGDYWYTFGEGIGEVNAFVGNDRHVAASTSDSTIHLWDFGAQ